MTPLAWLFVCVTWGVMGFGIGWRSASRRSQCTMSLTTRAGDKTITTAYRGPSRHLIDAESLHREIVDAERAKP